MADLKLDGIDNGGEMGGVHTGGGSIAPEPLRINDEGSPVIKSTKLVLGTGEHEPFKVTKLSIGTGETESKDPTGTDNTIPLSPQWLLSKPGDSKPPLSSGDPPRTPGSHGGASDFVSKERWRVDGNRDNEKRRDWRRPGADGDAGRRDRWREEEREGTQAGRRERWKDVGDGNNDSRRTDRWGENTTNSRDSVDPRRAQSERWPDSSNRDGALETGRRDSKWSTRWGPEDKEKREKRLENEKEGDGGQHRDRHPGRTESDRETDSTVRDRWRAPSIASRAKGEVPPLGSTPPKYAPGFGVGRGRGESSAIGFAAGRGRSNFSGGGVVPGLRPAIGAASVVDKSDASPTYWYPRAKLLDIYRKSSVLSSFAEHPEGFSKAPQLTEAAPLEPLAFVTPDGEEEAVLEGIRKGDIVSSGAVYSAPKDSKHCEDVIQNRPKGGQTNDGLEGGFSNFIKNERCGDKSIPHEQDTVAMNIVSSRTGGVKGLDLAEPFDIPVQGESIMSKSNTGHAMVELDGLMRQISSVEIKDVMDQRHVHLVGSGQVDEVERLGDRREIENLAGLLEKTITLEADKKNEVFDKFISMPKRDVLELDKGTGHGDRKEAVETDYNHTSPEELSLFYIDPHGEIQGPFVGADIIGWFDLGYFGTDLLVRLADAPENTPFTELGSAMPHLKTKGLALPGNAASPNHLDDTNTIIDKETLSLELPQKAGVDRFEHAEASRSSLFLHDKELYDGSLEIGRRLRIDESHLHDGRRDVAAEQVVDVDMSAKQGSIPSLWHNMSVFPDLERDNVELSKQSLFSQHWPTKNEFAQPVAEPMPRSNGHVSPRLQIPQAALWQSRMQSDPLSSPLMKDGAWHDAALLEGSSLSHGLDDFHMHQLQQIENQQLQAQAGLPFPHPAQQQQHPLLELLSQQRASVPPLEQLHNPALSNDFNVNKLHRLSPPHSSHLLPSYPYSTHQEQQQTNFQIPGSDSIIDHILKLQQQQQQQQQQQHQHLQQPQHQQQQHPQAFLEQLLKQHQHFSGANHPNVATQHFLQDNSSLDHHLEELRQRQTLLELLLRRQQEEQFQAQQHARFLQQQQSKLDERRVSGVWEVDEFGQFVRTQASTPMQVHGSHQQQQELLLRHQPSFPQMVQPQAQKLQLEATGLHGMNLQQQPKADMRTPLDFQADRNLATLLGRASRMDSLPSDFVQHLQMERGGFERQSSLPEHGSIPLAMDVLRQSQANEAGGRGWGTGSHGADMNMMEMYQVGEGIAPKRTNHLFKQNQFPGLNWPQDMTSVNDNLQNFPINSDFLRHSPRDNQGIGFRMQQEQQGKRTGHGTDEDLSRLLTSSSSSKQGDFPASMFYNEDPFMSNLSGSNHQVDSISRIRRSTPQAAWNSATSSRVNREETDWQCAESASQFDSSAASQPPRHPMAQCEAADFWGTSASMIQESSTQLPVFVHSSFDQGELARESSHDLGANGNVLSLSIANRNSSSLMKEVSDNAAALVDEGEFMESKDSKKNKKRNAKGKVSSVGKAASVTLPDVPISAVGKPSKVPHMFEELSSVNPPAPSLGDFLLRKDEQMFSQSLPAWSVEPNIHVTAAKSLKDIQEAEKRARDEPGQILQLQMQTSAPKLSNPIMINSNASAWQRPLLSSPSQFVAQSKNQSSSLTHPGLGKLKTGVENDEQFWDYGDAGVTKQAFRTDWQDNSQLLKRDHSAMGASVKGSENLPYHGSSGFSASVSRQPSMKSASKQAEAPPQVQLSVMEARVFRQWCESQIKKFSGKGHMALLEFCMSLPSLSEAGDYLTMYLGSEPAAEAFKAEFIRHKAMIPPDVAHVVFPVSEAVIKDELDPYEGEKRTDVSSTKIAEEEDNEFEMVRSGKRKGRKGKKVVDPSLVLGFSVSNSNRILMGEIQHMND